MIREEAAEMYLKKGHVVLVQYSNSALTRPETIAVFEKQRLNSNLKNGFMSLQRPDILLWFERNKSVKGNSYKRSTSM